VEHLGRSKVTCTNLSDAPAAVGQPVTVKVESLDRPSALEITYRYDDPSVGVEVSGQLDDIDLRDLQQSLSSRNPVTFEQGTASTAISGRLSRDTIDLALDVETRGLKARTSGDAMFGLDPQITNEAMRVLENLQTRLRIVGPTTQPRLAFDVPGLEASFKAALVDAGKNRLAEELDKQLGDQMPEGVPGAKEAVKDPVGAAQDALGGLLGGGKKEEEDKPEEP
jgi:hypothetical protein